ncbi:MAG TPA: Asp-tRNA(Asn)/Glu-tRNA(Gln) amidotransferase subunit GatB [Vitreimonas sp.]|nr:Asp-tRNA(Asn)/Glu-tRNA(Gln) amidotransferase subunit GatB [Vitreimonas sp.]
MNSNYTSSGNFSLVCGLEVHAELKTETKMFCGCKNDPFFAPGPNTYTCPVCLGMPGALPVANKKAIEWTIRLGLALGCKINLFSKFDRKHYFYPDLPKGYQISQYDLPFCYEGLLETSFGPVRIRRIHLEEDTGKLQHKTVEGQKVSLIDFNRSSVPLIEIVTEPDIKSPEQAKEYGKKLRQLLRYLDIADCDMEQGGMRLEANISVRTAEQAEKDELPTYKVEVKNINSFRFMEQAIGFEIQRQSLVLMDGETPKQETRGWNSSNNTTFPQRTKEDAEDYRYFPDPDLPPIRFTQKQIDELSKQNPELPEKVVSRWQKEYKVEPRFGEALVDSVQSVFFYDELFSLALENKLDANKVASAIINKKTKVVEGDVKLTLSDFQQQNQTDLIDESVVMTLISELKTEFPAETTRFQQGEEKLLNFFFGQLMKKLGKKVDAGQLRALLMTELKS